MMTKQDRRIALAQAQAFIEAVAKDMNTKLKDPCGYCSAKRAANWSELKAWEHLTSISDRLSRLQKSGICVEDASRDEVADGA
jgi:hypothetical protein